MSNTNKYKYGFQGHLSPEFPSQIVIDVTELCNLACIHCPQSEFVKSNVFGGRNLDTELHKKLIDEVAQEGRGFCKFLRYTGDGETLLHPNFIEMIQYASNNSGIPINITTNGTLLTEIKAKALLEAGVDVVDISIDAYSPETYSLIRRKGDLNITRLNVLKLIELIHKGEFKTKVVVSFVAQPLNMNESADFEKFWKASGAYYVVVRRRHSAGGAKDDIAQDMKSKQSSERRPCLYPWERLVLKPNGFITYCPADWKGQASISSFKNKTIKEIWQGEYMQKLREAHVTNKFASFDFCKQCPDWIETRWPDEGRAYSSMMREIEK